MLRSPCQILGQWGAQTCWVKKPPAPLSSSLFWLLLPSHPIHHLSFQSGLQLLQQCFWMFLNFTKQAFFLNIISNCLFLLSQILLSNNSSSSWVNFAVHRYEKLIWVISIPEKLQKTPGCVKAECCYKLKSSIRQLYQSTGHCCKSKALWEVSLVAQPTCKMISLRPCSIWESLIITGSVNFYLKILLWEERFMGS